MCVGRPLRFFLFFLFFFYFHTQTAALCTRTHQDQLCTDDFEGPSPHNTNLALKGIVGLGAWSDYLKQIGDTQNATRVQAIAKVYASYWEDHALNPSDKDHYKLQYDLSNTWSLKYNLLFDVIL